MNENEDLPQELKAALANERWTEAREEYRDEYKAYQLVISNLPKDEKGKVRVAFLNATQKFNYAQAKLRFSEASKRIHKERARFMFSQELTQETEFKAEAETEHEIQKQKYAKSFSKEATAVIEMLKKAGKWKEPA